jgi:hypothetical protein
MGPALARQVWEYFHPQESDPLQEPEVHQPADADLLAPATS